MSTQSDGRAGRGRAHAVLIESHLWTATQVTSLATFATLALDLPIRWTPLAMVFAATLFIYNIDRAFDLLRRERPAGRGEFRATMIRCGLALTILSLAVAFTTATAAALVVLGTLLCSAYGAPLRSTGRRANGRRIKDVPGLKAWFVGIAVAVATVLVPMADADRLDPHGLPIGLLVAAATIVNAHMFDVRDRPTDRAHGLRTMPVMLGLARTRWMLSAIAVGLSGLAALLAVDTGFSLVIHASVMSAALLACIWRLDERSPRASYGWWVDGLLVLPLLVTLSSAPW